MPKRLSLVVIRDDRIVILFEVIYRPFDEILDIPLSLSIDLDRTHWSKNSMELNASMEHQYRRRRTSHATLRGLGAVSSGLAFHMVISLEQIQPITSPNISEEQTRASGR